MTKVVFSVAGSTNLVGKFTQSVRRIVQDVKDEGSPSKYGFSRFFLIDFSWNVCATGGLTRDEIIETNERLRCVRVRLEESYDTAKKALVNLMNKYGDSKIHKNIFARYPMLKLMIKVSEDRFRPKGTKIDSSF